MRNPALRRFLCSGVVLLAGLAAGGEVPAGDAGSGVAAWPQFRGPGARGVDDGGPLPAVWNGSSGENILWKTPVPGLAHSSPVIWGDRLFVTTAISDADTAGIKTGLYGDVSSVEDESVHRFEVWCLDRRTGEVLWKRLAHQGPPRIKRHLKSTHANPTPAVDGKRVVVSFGSAGLYAYDLDGAPLWRRDLGLLDSGYYLFPAAQWGFGSSPVLHDGRVIVQADVQGDSFLTALDAATGEEIWRTARDEVPTWSTPTVHAADGTRQVIVNGFKHIGGYDFDTGAEIWRMKGSGDIPVPTPYVAGGLIYFTSAHGPGSPIYVVRANARGTIERDAKGAHPHLAWSKPRGGSYMPTTVVYRGLLYVCRDNGGLTVYDAATGEELDQRRLGGGGAGFIAAAVAGDGKVYFTNEDGVTFVVAAGREIEVVAENPLGEITLASAAIADRTLYFRTRDHLVAVGDREGPDAKPAPAAPAEPADRAHRRRPPGSRSTAAAPSPAAGAD